MGLAKPKVQAKPGRVEKKLGALVGQVRQRTVKNGAQADSEAWKDYTKGLNGAAGVKQTQLYVIQHTYSRP